MMNISCHNCTTPYNVYASAIALYTAVQSPDHMWNVKTASPLTLLDNNCDGPYYHIGNVTWKLENSVLEKTPSNKYSLLDKTPSNKFSLLDKTPSNNYSLLDKTPSNKYHLDR